MRYMKLKEDELTECVNTLFSVKGETGEEKEKINKILKILTHSMIHPERWEEIGHNDEY